MEPIRRRASIATRGYNSPMPSTDRLNIAILAAGAGGMYCGSCLRDNALALALRRMGHDAVMVPLYTPVKTDDTSAAVDRVFYGGVNTYLQHASWLFRKTPRALDWLFDRPWLLKWAGSKGAQASPAKLGQFTLDVLRGESGNTVKELKRLCAFLRDEIRPHVVTLPNLMFVGAARMLKQETGAAIVAECTGEDIFLDAMAEPHKAQAQAIIRQRAPDVDGFVATSDYYADVMAAYLGVPRQRIEVVYPGIPADDLSDAPRAAAPVPTVGYLARVCPEKGLDRLVDAMLLLRQIPGMASVRLQAAGYLGAAHHAWFDQLRSRIAASPLAGAFEYLGEVDKPGKRAMLDAVDVLCVPTAYAEAKGIYVLESLARGTPVVLPHHGSFPELVNATGGGVTVPPGDAPALAGALASLLADPPRRWALGEAGRRVVRERFLDQHMARGMESLFVRARSGAMGVAIQAG